jgi:hypothetical protein
MLLASTAGLAASPQDGPQRAHAPRVRVTKLSPAQNTDEVLDEIFLAQDDAGHRRVIMSGPLNSGKTTRFFWAVDPATNKYHVLRLSRDHANDAKRIQKLYRQYGMERSADEIAARLSKNGDADAQRSRDLMQQMTNKAFAQRARRSSPVDFSVGGPLSDEGEEGGGQIVQQCLGYGYSDIQTWEPAKYLFNVDHLNETYEQATWFHEEPSGVFNVSPSGSCWSTDASFIGTYWATTYCSPQTLNFLDHGFDLSETGQYVNTDFAFMLSTIINPTHPLTVNVPITVTATASVQYANGVALWGAQYYEDTLPQDLLETLLGLGEQFLLTGNVSGTSSEFGCGQYCNASQERINACNAGGENPQHWDDGLCECVADASPIIIDLGNNGMPLTSATDGVTFDILANGHPVRVAWTRRHSQDAFLVLDRNHNGTIDSGAELFGDVTPQPASATPNGFLALAVFDHPSHGGNGDGQITEEDSVYQDLRLWVDANHDGISQPEELRSLVDAGLRALSLHYVPGKRVDEFGNVFKYRSHVTMDGDLRDGAPIRRRAVDVFLTFIP